MPAIPLPFVASGLLVFVAIIMMRRRMGSTMGQGWFLLFVGACAAQSALVGLRWSIDPLWVHFVQPVLATCLPPLAWAAFAVLRGRRMSLLHALWPIAAAASWWILPSAIDPLIVVEFVLYGVLILRLPLPDHALTHVRIGDEWVVSYAQHGAAALLILSAIVDVIVALDLANGDGAVAAPAIAAMMGVILVGLAGGVLARMSQTVPAEAGEPPPREPPATASETTEEGQAVLGAIEAALAQGLYRDCDLTLQRLSRRTRIPARKISQAVNRVQGVTVTDLVNGYRVREAMRLLREGNLPITQVMLESGFQTKSNFNRAFREIAGQTPSDYRRLENG